MNYHFIGISGSAMSGLAEIVRALGHHVTGSELATTGHRAENIAPGTDRVVYTPAVREGTPGWVEVDAARRAGIPALRSDELVAELTAAAELVGITGSHGKSSTTGMMAAVAIAAGKNPTVSLGAPIPSWEGRNYRIGDPEFWVLEADDYDRKFLLLAPSIAVVTNVEAEHLDVYRDLAEIQGVFAEFLGRVRAGGAIVAHADASVDTVLAQAALRSGIRVIRYGDGTEYPESKVPELKMIGRHQRENAAAVLAVADILGFADEQVVGALRAFPGVGRRLEYIGERAGVAVYDDYGHHPTEIQATLTAVREWFPGRRLVVAFQAHQHSRVHALFDEFARSFHAADLTLLADIYEVPGRDESVRVETRALADAIEAEGVAVQYVGSLEQLAERLDDVLVPNDVFVTMGATEVTHIGRSWVQERGPHG